VDGGLLTQVLPVVFLSLDGIYAVEESVVFGFY